MHRVDADHLPDTSGVADRCLSTREGEAHGLVLGDRTGVHRKTETTHARRT